MKISGGPTGVPRVKKETLNAIAKRRRYDKKRPKGGIVWSY